MRTFFKSKELEVYIAKLRKKAGSDEIKVKGVRKSVRGRAAKKKTCIK